MADSIALTGAPTKVVPGDVFQSLWSAVDVQDYKSIDLEIEAVGWEAPLGGASLSIVILTGFQRESAPEGWWPLAFATLTPTSPTAVVHLPNQTYRYLMWECSTVSNATSALIWIRGIARDSGD